MNCHREHQGIHTGFDILVIHLASTCQEFLFQKEGEMVIGKGH